METANSMPKIEKPSLLWLKKEIAAPVEKSKKR